MKKIFELRSKRADLKKELRSNLKAVEKRELSDEEKQKMDEVIEAIEKLDEEIETLEKALEAASADEPEEEEVEQRSVNIHTRKEVRKYDLAKAIREFRNGNLTGLEKEMHQEGQKEFRSSNGLIIPSMLIERRSTVTKTTNAGDIAQEVKGLDVIAESLLDKMGVTVYENLTANVSLPYSKGYNGGLYSEGETAGEGTNETAHGLLSSKRFQFWKKYSTSYLAQSAIVNDMFGDMISAIDRIAFAEVAKKAVVANILAGRGTTATAADLTWKDITKMLAAVTASEFQRPAFVGSKELMYDLQATEKVASSGKFINENDVIAGYSAVGTSALPVHTTNKYDVIFGDWKRSYVGFFTGVMLLFDELTSADTGEVKITCVRLGDVSVNPFAFTSIRNAKLA